MNTKKFIRVFFFCLLACFSAQVYAEVWSIQVIQHDGNKEDIRSSSYLIEDSLMEFFFERGQIASTVPAVTSLGSAYDSKLEDVDEQVSTVNKVLNILLTVLLIILVCILGVLVYYILKSRGII